SAIPANGVIVNTLANTTSDYTVRIYDATDDACYVDRVVSITAILPKPVLSVSNGLICSGGSIDLSTLVTSNVGGSPSFHSTYSNAVAGAPAIGATVSPSTATNYYIRSTSVSGCFTVKEVTVAIRAANCGVITVTGPN
ncbi:MAG TPA: hypothetical protein PKD78_09260, partial [Saprospiraceae bacterium]|nr:hypothetical protein [Saprospiraceae bacterium]